MSLNVCRFQDLLTNLTSCYPSRQGTGKRYFPRTARDAYKIVAQSAVLRGIGVTHTEAVAG